MSLSGQSKMSARLHRLRPSARKVVLLTWEAVDRGVPLQAALSQVLQDMSLSGETRRQATDLAYWTFRGMLRCTFVLQTLFPRFDKFLSPVRRLLVIAAAALLFQERAPQYAIVNETVADIAQLAGKGVAGAANGGLRNLLRLGQAVHTQEFYRQSSDRDDYAAFLRLVSIPPGIGYLLRRELGEEAARRALRQSFERPVAALRVNIARTGWQDTMSLLRQAGGQSLPGKAGQRGLWFPDGLPASVSVQELIASGRVSSQSAGSQLVLAHLEFPDEAPVWDVCAGFGGKTMALLEEGHAVTLATDISWRRLSHLSGECARLGLNVPHVLLADGTRPPLDSWPGHVLLDVPCSGLGVLGRRPDIKLREPDIAAYTRVQKELVQSLLQRMTRGRCLAYITCTLTCQENEQLLREALEGTGAHILNEWLPGTETLTAPGAVQGDSSREFPVEGMYAALVQV